MNKPLSTGSVVEQIIRRLTEALSNRELQPGQKIPTEMELCESLQVGRNSVREAIKILVAMGVLEIRRSEGTFVCRGFSSRMLDPLVYGLILEGGGSGKLIELRRIFVNRRFHHLSERFHLPLNGRPVFLSDFFHRSLHYTLVKNPPQFNEFP